MELTQFLNEALSDPAGVWESARILDLATLTVPDVIFGGRKSLLKCDINRIWATWFLNSVCDIDELAESRSGFAHIYARVLDQLRLSLPGIPFDELYAQARCISQLLYQEMERRTRRRRVRFDEDLKQALVDAALPSPRCWICGYAFTSSAIERFFGGKKSAPIDLPRFIDVFRSAGLRESDLDIEIDHVVPHSAGGGEADNLALCCGWCNRHKGAFGSIYDQALTPLRFTHPLLGPISIPRPFWVVRLLATRRRCEFVGKCSRSSSDSELVVDIRNRHGAANPANLMVVCLEHDSMSSARFVFRGKWEESEKTG